MAWVFGVSTAFSRQWTVSVWDLTDAAQSTRRAPTTATGWSNTTWQRSRAGIPVARHTTATAVAAI
eukprot:4318816-Pyramimonas_sp.AAC.1